MQCRYFKLRDKLMAVIYNSLSESDFEQGWVEVVTEFEVVENDWLKNLYEERHMWVPVFMCDHFWAGMRSTQRVESIHSFFDQFVGRNTLLHEFGERYVTAIEKRIHQEKVADEKGPKYLRYLSTGYRFERVFRDIYTTTKFKVLQKECQKVTYCLITEEKKVDDVMSEYAIRDRVWVLPEGGRHWVLTDKKTFYRVTFNAETREAICNCKMFETQGIMCRHLIRLYDHLEIEQPPQKYILRRWRRDVVRKHTSIRVAYHDLSRTEEVKRLDRLVAAFDTLTDEAVKSERCTQIVLKGLQRIREELEAALAAESKRNKSATSQAESNGMPEPDGEFMLDVEGDNSRSPTAALQSQCSEVRGNGARETACSENTEGVGIKDPPIPRRRGRPRNSRFKTIAETGWRCYRSASRSGSLEDNETMPQGKGKKGKAASKKSDGKGKRKAVEVEVYKPTFLFLMVLLVFL